MSERPARLRKGEIIAIGSELLLGGRLDSNSLFLSEALAAAGVDVRFKSVVGDEARDIAAALRAAVGRADVVLLTGGLGPTSDDCTRQAVALAARRPLRLRSEAVRGIRRQLSVWGRTPSAAQLRQGLIPTGADVLSNPVGSAPGFALRWKGALIAALPGVPAEAKEMFATGVAPLLAGLNGTRAGRRLDRRVLHTFGLPEAEVDQRLVGAIPPASGIQLGLLAAPLGVLVSLSRWAEVSKEGKHPDIMDRTCRRVRQRLRPYVYAEGAETMEDVIGRQLTSRGLTLAVAESCTGGLIGHRLTQVPGSSAYLDRVAVVYSNQAKQAWLGVPHRLLKRHGAVSAEVAAAMAKGIRKAGGTAIGLSVTGIAGPGGGTETKPVGLVYVGLATGPLARPEVRTQAFRFHGTRDVIKLRSSQAALDLLRQWLEGMGRPRA